MAATLGIEADWWLYVVLFAAVLILLAVNAYVVVLWQHPDDKNEAYFPKAVVVSWYSDGSLLVGRPISRPLRGCPTFLRVKRSVLPQYVVRIVLRERASASYCSFYISTGQPNSPVRWVR